jgi:anaerobic dimethyl sulfoxide reductase subunit B (iron-sulfur subunit)
LKNHELGFVFHKENCIQCNGCVTACKTWRSVALGIHWRRVFNIWHGSYPYVTCSALSVSCQHCVEPACADACPTQAIIKSPSDGTVLVDSGKCIGCRACSEACPFDVPQFGPDGIMQKCDMCRNSGSPEEFPVPPCARDCPTRALELKMLPVSEKTDNEALLRSEFSDVKKNR